jgi:hypothetical protein
MKEALQALMTEMKYVLCCINLDKMPFDGDDFHEALRLGEAALAQDEASSSRAAPVQEPVAYSGNGTAGREADVRPTGFFFQMPKPEQKQEPISFGIRGGMAHDIGIKND